MQPPVVDDFPDQTYCPGDVVNLIWNGPPGQTYEWTASNTFIGIPPSGTGDINFIAADVQVPTLSSIQVFPFLGNCQGINENFHITVLPTPTLTPPPNLTVCGNTPVGVNFSGSQGATFEWTNDNPAIGLATSGTGNLNFTSAPVSQQETATITVTPVYTSGGTSCPGEPESLTITVNPAPQVDDPPDQSVCAGDAVAVAFSGTGNSPTYAWTNSNPAIGLAPSGSGNINFTAANVSAVQTATITVSATEGLCTGPPQPFSIQVKPRPTAGPQANRTLCAGEMLSVNFAATPAGTTFSWLNSNPAIGLDASGTGNISFTAAAVDQQETATITATPELNGCAGVPISFTIIVNPPPTIDPLPNLTVCAGEDVDVPFSGTSGSTYAWTNSNTAIGLGPAGTGAIFFTAANPAVQQTGMLSATPTALGCVGEPTSFSITVLPAPVLQPPADVSVCGGDSLTVAFSGPPGTVFQWTNDNPATGLSASGSGPIQFLAAAVADTQLATIAVTPVSVLGCSGEPGSFSLAVVPCCATSAGVLDSLNIVVCGPQTIAIAPPANVVLEPGDTLRFILFENPADPLGSIVQYSDSLIFPFLPGIMQLDSAYYVAALAGPLLANDSLDVSSSCFSISGGPVLRWLSKPTIAVSTPPEAVCKDGCVEVQFDFTGTPPFSFSWQVVQNGQLLYARDETSDTYQKIISVCPGDFTAPAAGGNVDFRVVFFMDGFCSCLD